MLQEEALAASSEDPSSSDDSDGDHDPEPAADEPDDHDQGPVVEAEAHDQEPVVEAEALPAADDQEPAEAAQAPLAEVSMDKVHNLLQRANRRGKSLQAMDWFTQRIGQALPCLDGKVLTAEALNSAADMLCLDAD